MIAGAVGLALTGLLALAWIGSGPRRLASTLWAADRRIGPWTGAWSAALTTLSPAGTMVMAGFVAGGRIDLLLAEVGAALALIAFGLALAPAARMAGVLAPLEWLRALLGRRVGTAVALLDVLFGLGWIAVALLSLAGIAARLVEWPGIGVAAGALLAALLALAGARGLARAAAAAGLLLIGAAVATWLAVFLDEPRSAGLRAIGRGFAAASPPVLGWVLGLVYLAREWSLGATWQRAFMAADAPAARRTFVLAGLIRVSVVALVAVLGRLAAARLSEQRMGLHDTLLLLAESLPPPLAALLTAALVAALVVAVALLLQALLASLDRLRPAAMPGRVRRAGVAGAVVLVAMLLTGSHTVWDGAWTAGGQVYHGILALLLAPAVLVWLRTRRRGESPAP